MDESTFICFSSYEGSTSFLVTVDQCWKSARLRGGVETATPIRPITGRPWLSPAFLYPPFPQRSLRNRLPPEEAQCRVYHVPLEQHLDDLAPACYTGSRPIRVPAY